MVCCVKVVLMFCRLHSEKLKQLPILVLDAGMEFENDPEVREMLTTKVCTHTHHLFKVTDHPCVKLS